MKHKPLILLAFLLLLSVYSFGQTFNWNDKGFKPNTARRLVIWYGLDRAKLRSDPSNHCTLDTLVMFLKKNPQLKVEIDNHQDALYPSYHASLTQARAQCVVDTLIKLGIDSARLIAKGWGATQQIISQSVIDKMKRKSEKDSAYAINRRTEVRIISTCYGHETFNWTDSVFYIGSKRIFRVMYGIERPILTPESLDTLNIVVQFLKKHPDLKVEIASHTDQQGSLAHNKTLSQARSQSIVNYIISQGIDSARVIPKGYAWDEPIIPMYQISNMKTKQEKDSAYAINRRTEVRIIGKLP
ncbi:MAG TPA: OmpA family protein [Bacteroidia bacterium]|jgi:outer membrane protein OmpA-like peptidoglycan-associated protein|nr:OmpA family protein [Bacteroidia bacterium]